MRAILASFLVFLIASCPIWCGIVEVSLGISHACSHGTPNDPAAPHPVNDDNCVCNGSLHAAYNAILASDFAPHALPLDLVLVTLDGSPEPDGSAPAPGDGPPTGRASPSQRRATLQNYRC